MSYYVTGPGMPVVIEYSGDEDATDIVSFFERMIEDRRTWASFGQDGGVALNFALISAVSVMSHPPTQPEDVVKPRHKSDFRQDVSDTGIYDDVEFTSVDALDESDSED